MSIWKEEEPINEPMDIESCMEALSEYLFSELAKRKCSVRELSNGCGLCTRELEKIIKRETPGIRLATFLKIAQGLGTSASQMFAEMESSAG